MAKAKGRGRKGGQKTRPPTDLAKIFKERSGELRRRALEICQRSNDRPVRMRKLAKVVLAECFSPKDRGAGSWADLSFREPIMLEHLSAVLKRSKKMSVTARGEVAVRRNESKSKQSGIDYKNAIL